MRYTNDDNKKDKNRFKLLLEYGFYMGEEEDVYEPSGNVLIEEPELDDGEEELDAEPTDAGEEELDAEPTDTGEEELPEPELMSGEEELPEPELMGDEEEVPEPGGDFTTEDEVELDVTELVQGTVEAKNSADQANAKVSDLLTKFDNLTTSLEKMATINAKIDNLENEVEKRNPTPEEKLEMRSLDSFPYNLKLTDYWSEKEGHYDAMKNGKEGNENTEEEFVLTKNDVEQDYNPMFVKDSFGDNDDINGSF